jgi:hypothetical protein
LRRKLKEKNSCPCNRPWSTTGLWTSRLPHWLDNLLTDGDTAYFFCLATGNRNVAKTIWKRMTERRKGRRRKTRKKC